MLGNASSFVRMSEVNPPDLPDMSHLLLDGTILMGVEFETIVDEAATARNHSVLT